MQGTLIKMTEMNGCYCSNLGTSGAKNVAFSKVDCREGNAA